MNRNDRDFIVSRIRENYTEKASSDVERLRALDAKVRRPADVAAYIIGSIGALVLGSGMSLVMTDIAEKLSIANSMPIGIAVGIVGLIITIVNYPVHKSFLASRRRKYAGEVIALSDSIMGK